MLLLPRSLPLPREGEGEQRRRGGGEEQSGAKKVLERKLEEKKVSPNSVLLLIPIFFLLRLNPVLSPNFLFFPTPKAKSSFSHTAPLNPHFLFSFTSDPSSPTLSSPLAYLFSPHLFLIPIPALLNGLHSANKRLHKSLKVDFVIKCSPTLYPQMGQQLSRKL